MTTTYSNLTIHTQDGGAYYLIAARDIEVNDRGAYVRVSATWNHGEDDVDTIVDVHAEELSSLELGALSDCLAQAQNLVSFIRTHWRAMIDAHLEAERAAA